MSSFLAGVVPSSGADHELAESGQSAGRGAGFECES